MMNGPAVRGRCPVLVLAGICSFGCAEPSFVSLGRNLSAVQREGDAGAELERDAALMDQCPVAEGNLVRSDCEEREVVRCPAPSVEVPDALDGALSRLLLQCEA